MPLPAARTVVLLVFDGVQLLDVAGPMDVFDAANRVVGRDVYQVLVASPGGAAVTTGSGLAIGVTHDLDPAGLPTRVHTLLVAGGWGTEAAVANPEVVRFVAAVARRVQRVSSVCTGAFVLAEAGLLAGRRATTHWAFADDLAAGYPEIEVAPDSICVHDGNVATAAGVSAGIDLALSLVEQDLGAEVVRKVCRWLVVFLHRPGGQSQFSERLRRPAATPPIRAAMDRVTADPAADHRVDVLAADVNMSRRHFAREFRRQAGVTPGEYVELVRVEAAKDLLATTAETQGRIARAVGFGSEEVMRQAFRRRLAVTPGAYRDRFGDRPIAAAAETRVAPRVLPWAERGG